MISPVPHIQRATAEVYGIPIDDLLGDCRNRELARPRQLAMALSYVHTKHSHPEVGRFFRRDHTTVVHARRTIREAWDESMHKAAVEIMFAARDAWEAEKKKIRQTRNRSATT